jgi:hypothetical protein
MYQVASLERGRLRVYYDDPSGDEGPQLNYKTSSRLCR